jgi:hypothetical protein
MCGAVCFLASHCFRGASCSSATYTLDTGRQKHHIRPWLRNLCPRPLGYHPFRYLIGPVLRYGKVYRNLEASSHGLTQCNCCLTEFRLDFKVIGGSKAIFVTRWKDLGNGNSLLDYKWQFHGSPRDMPTRSARLEKGSIFAAFEQDTEFQFDSLISPTNEKDLLETASHLT